MGAGKEVGLWHITKHLTARQVGYKPCVFLSSKRSRKNDLRKLSRGDKFCKEFSGGGAGLSTEDLLHQALTELSYNPIPQPGLGGWGGGTDSLQNFNSIKVMTIRLSG